LGVLVLYLVLPLVIESFIEGEVQTAIGGKPEVEVFSTFPPMMLLGRIDRVQVTGLPYPYNVRVVSLKGVSVSVPSLINGNPSIKAASCSPPGVQNIPQIRCQQVVE
jgi:hypothetical protein